MALKLDKSNLVRNLAKKQRLGFHLDKYIEDNPDFEWSFEYTRKLTDDAWHPSGDCTPSPAELWHKAKMYEEKEVGGPYQKRKLSASLLKTFAVGHFWHAYLQTALINMGFALPENVERRGMKGWAEGPPRHYDHVSTTYLPWHWATGSADVCPCSIPGQGDFLVDFKTMGSHDFKRNQPSFGDKWECQANVYLDWFDLEEAIFVGICKDSPHEFKEYVYRRNQPLIDAIYLKWELVSHCLSENVEPPADEDIDLPLKGPVA